MSHAHSLPQKENTENACWGAASFLGPSHTIIACPADDAIHFWDCESRKYIYSLKIAKNGEEISELPLFSWIPQSPVPVMASATKSGSLRIWSVKQEEEKNEAPSNVPGRPEFAEQQQQHTIASANELANPMSAKRDAVYE